MFLPSVYSAMHSRQPWPLIPTAILTLNPMSLAYSENLHGDGARAELRVFFVAITTIVAEAVQTLELIQPVLPLGCVSVCVRAHVQKCTWEWVRETREGSCIITIPWLSLLTSLVWRSFCWL